MGICALRRVTAPLFGPIGADPSQEVDIVTIEPVGYPHAAAFAEVAETLQFAMRALGYAASWRRNSVRIGVPVIVLGAHLLQPGEGHLLPSGAIIYNLEQVRPGAWATNADYLERLRRHTVWDFNSANVAAIRQMTGHRDVHHVPVGYVSEMSRIVSAAVQDIDVLFYGSLTPRRERVLQDIAAAGLTVAARFGVYGAERDALIARAKLVVNLHAHDGWGFEAVRVSYLLANRKAVVCEAGEIDADLSGGVVAVPYDCLVDACYALVHDAVARERLETEGFRAFSARSAVIILTQALTARAQVATNGGTGGCVERYLALLAKCLTNQIYGDPPFDPWSGGQFDPVTRSLGRDWPSQAMTMIGDRRLDNIRQLFLAILAAEVPGDLIETGVWRGGACIFMRGLLKAYGVLDRLVWVADSFHGLPPPDERHVADAGDEHHKQVQLAVSLADVQENFRKFDLLDDQVRFLPGWFAETLHAAPIERLAMLRLDGDMYGSTMEALTALYHKVSANGFVIVDDYGAVPGCRAAVDEFRARRGITAPIHDIDGLGVYWRVPSAETA